MPVGGLVGRLAALAVSAFAQQTYPNRTIRMIAPLSPGGTLPVIVEMVAQAQRSRAPIQSLADKVSAWFVPAVIVVAIAAFVVWLVLGFEVWFALTNAVAVLIIACPCALGLATPMSIMVAAGKGAGVGVLFRNAEAIEVLRKVDTLVVDKTGTLTLGRLSLIGVVPIASGTREHFLALAEDFPHASADPVEIVVEGASRQEVADGLAALVAEGGGEPSTASWQTTNLVTVASALVASARTREETRGSHWREDFPDTDDSRWFGHVDATLADGGSLTIVTFESAATAAHAHTNTNVSGPAPNALAPGKIERRPRTRRRHAAWDFFSSDRIRSASAALRANSDDRGSLRNRSRNSRAFDK